MGALGGRLFFSYDTKNFLWGKLYFSAVRPASSCIYPPVALLVINSKILDELKKRDKVFWVFLKKRKRLKSYKLSWLNKSFKHIFPIISFLYVRNISHIHSGHLNYLQKTWQSKREAKKHRKESLPKKGQCDRHPPYKFLKQLKIIPSRGRGFIRKETNTSENILQRDLELPDTHK